MLSRRRIAVHEILQPMQIAIETTRIIQCKGRIENVRPFGEVFAPPRAESQTSNGVRFGIERRPVRRSVRQLRVQHHVKPPVRLVMNTVLAVDQDAP